MNYRKIIFNTYLFIWFAFGLLIFIYAWIDIALHKLFYTLTFIDYLRLGLPTVILFLYIIVAIQFKISNSPINNAHT